MRQGLFSAQKLKTDNSAWLEFCEHLKNDGCDIQNIREAFNSKDYEIVFACIIGDTQRRNIPFFSKVTLKDTFENLVNIMGFKCSFHFINLLPPDQQ
jgi:uncharacterized protein (TIGR04141 family)